MFKFAALLLDTVPVLFFDSRVFIQSLRAKPNATVVVSKLLAAALLVAAPSVNALSFDAVQRNQDLIQMKAELSSGNINFDWAPVSDADGYLLHRNGEFELFSTEPNGSLPLQSFSDTFSLAVYRDGVYLPRTIGKSVGQLLVDQPLAPVTAAITPTRVVSFSDYKSGKVFEGAEGFGTDTRAGKDGVICRVTNTLDSGPGTLRHCIELNEPRQIVFDVSGTIKLASSLVISSPHVSILGQTAPGKGVMITLEPWVKLAVLLVETHDVLIQHMRIRAGASWFSNCCRDAVSIGSRVPGQVYNVVLDHNSLSWGTDEVIDVWYDAHDVTLSYNIISEGLYRSTNSDGPAGRGLLVGADTYNISIHHNFFAHNYQRNPMVSNKGVTDVVNNLVYHWVSRGASIQAEEHSPKVNMVNNKFISLNEGESFQPSKIEWYDVSVNTTGSEIPQIYFSGNFGHYRYSETQPEWALAGTGWKEPYRPELGFHAYARHAAPAVTTTDANSLPWFLFDKVGATLPSRDNIDTRVLEEMMSRTGFMPDCVEGCDLNARGWNWY